MRELTFANLARVNEQALQCNASIRQQPSHFLVTEQLPFEPDAEGGHALLLIEKTQTNTDWLAKQLAAFAGVEEVAVGYAGLKDRHAVTTQWFSVKMEGIEEPDWSQFRDENWQIKTVTRHKKKLKRGVLSGNHFRLCLSQVTGEQNLWLAALKHIRDNGVPNYFAEQRFGHANLAKVTRWFESGIKPKKRQQRSMCLSAARSWLFNLVLSQRIQQANWNTAIAGDIVQMSGSHSFFAAESVDDVIRQRVRAFDIHPTGPLWGRGQLLTKLDCADLEAEVLENWQDWLIALERNGLQQDRRALRLMPEQFDWQFDGDNLWLSFYLPAGSYATAVLRELAVITDMALQSRITEDS